MRMGNEVLKNGNGNEVISVDFQFFPCFKMLFSSVFLHICCFIILFTEL